MAPLLPPSSSVADQAAPLLALMNERLRLLEGGHSDDGASIHSDITLRLRAFLDASSLEFRRIDRSSASPVLDKIVAYEAVHPVRDSRDLARRLADDRRYYALFHRTLPDEPLIFTELAFTDALAANADALLDPGSPACDPGAARCAVLYSISSCHGGLKGIPLGNTLLARVAAELDRTCPHLDTIATLSPVPGFRRWLAAALPSSSDDLERRQLVPLCAYYLLHVKRSGDPYDAVARFHLRNGARLERINWLSHTSDAGMRISAGLMVNYLYRRRGAPSYDAWANGGDGHASARVARLARVGSTIVNATLLRSSPRGSQPCPPPDARSLPRA